MKNKGFTLIELLAVIVILAIIALIAVPIILNIIGDAKKQSEQRSAELYLKAAELAVARKNLTGEFNPTSCGVITETTKSSYAGSQAGDLICGSTVVKVDIDGEVPALGTIVFSNAKVANGTTITYGTGDQAKTFNYDGTKLVLGSSDSTDEEETCVSTAPAGAVELGTSGEEFYKLWETDYEIAYLAKYNLIYGKKVIATNGSTDVTFEQDANNQDVMYSQARQGSTCGSESRGGLYDYAGMAEAYNAAYQSGNTDNIDLSSYFHTPWYSASFSASAYWYDNNQIKSTYANNAQYDNIQSGNIAKATVESNGYPIYVFDSNSSLYSVVQEYGSYLSQNGVNVSEARLLTYEEAVAQGCTVGNNSCESAPSWLTYTTYWLGSARAQQQLYYIDANNIIGEASYDVWETVGVRPVIVVSKID